MERKEFTQGSILAQKGQPVQSMLLILEGSVKGQYPGGEILLRKGDIIGLCATYYNSYSMTYTALEKLVVVAYPYQEGELQKLLQSQRENIQFFIATIFRQLQEVFKQYIQMKRSCQELFINFNKNYQAYSAMCEEYRISPRTLPGQEGLQPLILEEDIEPWLGGYYAGIRELIVGSGGGVQAGMEFYGGLILKISKDIHDIINVSNIMSEYRADMLRLFVNEENMDLLDLLVTIYFRAYFLADDMPPSPVFIDQTITLIKKYEYGKADFFNKRVEEYLYNLKNAEKEKATRAKEMPAAAGKVLPEISGSLNIILKYAECPEELADEFRSEVEAYKSTINKNSAEDAERRQRLVLTRLFYEIYTMAFQASLADEDIPTVLKMFFLFGYVDEELAGTENAIYLYDIASHIPSDPERNVYTVYDWLKAIYEGKKEPSRNEFDTDFFDHVHELKRTNKITAKEEAALLSNKAQKVMFELQNAFPITNKVTFGRITTFCPLFSEHNVLRSLDKMLVSADRINEIWDQIRARDFGAYYRETVYSQPEKGIVKEFIQVEILPDVILMPNIGSRGILWQEIEGKRRTTPARIMLSLFQTEDLMVILTRLTGEFRWEMCKRVQGVRWADITERSLTSEYSDYIQTYKKNSDLSTDARDRIKTDMSRCKNNTKEMFISDYSIWILFESSGAPRLNRVARNIIFTYCPFTKEIRDKLRTNPIFGDILGRYDIRMKQKIRHIDILCQKLRSSGLPVPEEIADFRAFMEA